MSAFSVATAYMEQLLTHPYSRLKSAANSSSFDIILLAGDGSLITFKDEVENTQSRMSFETNMFGQNASRSIPVNVTIDLEELPNDRLIEISVTYSWISPISGNRVTRDIRSIRNSVL